VTIRCIERDARYPSMGLLIEKGETVEIVEYTELQPNQEARFAYSGQLVFGLGFFRKMAEVDLPLHWVHKKIGQQWMWKGEQFIFDVLPFAARVRSVCAPCETSYAPLKSKEHIAQVEERLRRRG
jgi:UDP-N-acetylglucosamine pyrophosphorylase